MGADCDPITCKYVGQSPKSGSRFQKLKRTCDTKSKTGSLREVVGGEVSHRHITVNHVQNLRLFRRADGRTESFKSFYETGETLSA